MAIQFCVLETVVDLGLFSVVTMSQYVIREREFLFSATAAHSLAYSSSSTAARNIDAIDILIVD